MKSAHYTVSLKLILLSFLVLCYVLGSLLWIYLRDGNQTSLHKRENSKSLGEYYSEYQLLTQSAGAKSALDSLRKTIRKDPLVAKNCHGIAHQIGQTAYVIYSSSFSDASQFQDSVCNSGYIHGVIAKRVDISISFNYFSSLRILHSNL